MVKGCVLLWPESGRLECGNYFCEGPKPGRAQGERIWWTRHIFIFCQVESCIRLHDPVVYFCKIGNLLPVEKIIVDVNRVLPGKIPPPPQNGIRTYRVKKADDLIG